MQWARHEQLCLQVQSDVRTYSNTCTVYSVQASTLHNMRAVARLECLPLGDVILRVEQLRVGVEEARVARLQERGHHQLVLREQLLRAHHRHRLDWTEWIALHSTRRTWPSSSQAGFSHYCTPND